MCFHISVGMLNGGRPPVIPTLFRLTWRISWVTVDYKATKSILSNQWFKIPISTTLSLSFQCALLFQTLPMAPSPRNTEAHPIQLPTIPPTPCPSPTSLASTCHHTALTHNLSENSDLELQSPIRSPCGAFSLSKWPKVIGVSIAFLALLSVGRNLRVRNMQPGLPTLRDNRTLP